MAVQILTYNQVIQSLKDFARNYPLYFFEGQNWDIGQDRSASFPALQVYSESARLVQNSIGEYRTLFVTLNCKVVDQTTSDKSNQPNVHSDTLQVGQDLVNWFNQHPFFNTANLALQGDVDFSTLEKYTTDFLNGHEFKINLKLVNHATYAGLPFDDYLGFSPNGVVSTGYTTTISYLTSDTLTGNTILQYFIQNAINENKTHLQPGLNTFTGGTTQHPSVNISAATLTYLSATSLSASSIFSGSTSLYDIFSSESVRIQPGLNTYTGGTDFAPTVNISGASLSYLNTNSISAATINSTSVNPTQIVFTNTSSVFTGSTGITFNGNKLSLSGTQSDNILFQIGSGILFYDRYNGFAARNGAIIGGVSINNAPGSSYIAGTTGDVNLTNAYGAFNVTSSTGFKVTTGGLISNSISATTFSAGTLSIASSAILTQINANSNTLSLSRGGIVGLSLNDSNYTDLLQSNGVRITGQVKIGGGANPAYPLDVIGRINSSSLSATTISGGTLYSGTTNLYSIFARPELTVNSVRGAGNIVTGGTSIATIIQVSANPIFNDLTLSGTVRAASLSATSISGGTIYSGSTPLSTIISNLSVVGSTTLIQPGLNTYTGGTSSAPTINISAATLNNLSAGTITATTINTSVRPGRLAYSNALSGLTGTTDLVFDNTLGSGTISRLQIGDSAGYGQLDLNGFGENIRIEVGTDSYFTTTNGGFVFRPAFVEKMRLTSTGLGVGKTPTQLLDIGGRTNSNELSSTTVSATTYYSGTTPLSTTIINIANAAAASIIDTNDITRVQPGNYISTGGTANAPIIQLAQNFSGATISGGTLYSGTTNLSNLIISIANSSDTNDITRIQQGTNITTGGTANAPSISLIASPSINNLTASGTSTFANGSIRLSALTATSGLINFPFESGGTLSANRTININSNIDAVYSLSGGGTSVTTSTASIQMSGVNIVIATPPSSYVTGTNGSLSASYTPLGNIFLSGFQTYNTGKLLVGGEAYLTGGTSTTNISSPLGTITTFASTTGTITNVNTDNAQIKGGNISATTLSATTLSAETYCADSTGANPIVGTASLVSGTIRVNTTRVTVNSKIFLSYNTTNSSNIGFLYEDKTNRVPGTSFDILSSNGADTADVSWFIVEPY